MPSFAGLGKFFGRTASEGAAFAAGIAVAPVLGPVVREIENEANAKYESHPLSAGDAAGIVAEDVEAYDFGKTEASYNGINETRFKALLGEVLNAPGIGELFEAYRRGFITDDMFTHGLRKAKLETMWDEPLKKLKTQLLDLAPIGDGIQRGLVAAPFPLPYSPPGAGGKIPSFPTSNIDAKAHAEGLGYTVDDLFLVTALAGNPPGPEALYHAQFRDAINDVDVARGLAEGRSRQEWGPAFEAVARAIPSPANFVEGRIRNWIKDADMFAGAARHGMTEADTELLFLIHGRPLTHNQVFIGILRGGVYDGPTDMIDPHFLKSLQESDMRPEWYNLAWHARFHFPPFFQTINALNKGWIDGPTATQWLLFQAYDPDAVKAIVDRVAGSKATPKDSRVASAQTKLITGIEKAFVGGVLDSAGATTQLKDAGLAAATITGMIGHWTQLKALEALPPPA